MDCQKMDFIVSLFRRVIVQGSKGQKRVKFGQFPQNWSDNWSDINFCIFCIQLLVDDIDQLSTVKRSV